MVARKCRRIILGLLAATLAATACAWDTGPWPQVPTPAEHSAGQLAAAAQEAEESRVSAFLVAVRPLVGDAPVECNSDLRGSVVPRVGSAAPDAVVGWFVCAQAARTARRPFLIVLQQWGVDSWIVTGVAGRTDGSVRAFVYDAGCCRPSPVLHAGVCESPTARTDHGGAYGVRCANADGTDLVPMPEHWLRAAPLDRALDERLHDVVGPDAIDCGLEVHPGFARPAFSSYFLQAAFECAMTHRESAAPFRLLLQQRGAGSTIVVGLVGTTVGEVSRFRYDSAPRASGEPLFEMRRCEYPSLVHRDGTADIDCGQDTKR
jgi:hypothetical protein